MRWSLEVNVNQKLLIRVQGPSLFSAGFLNDVLIVQTIVTMISNPIAIGFWKFCCI